MTIKYLVPALLLATLLNVDRAAGQASVEFFRTYVVTTTASDGPGSLADAIAQAHTECPLNDNLTAPAPVACRIVFNLPPPVPASGWYTIRPSAPLQVRLRAFVIDGASQTAATGDTNPLGPEVEISGELVSEGSGFEVTTPCELQISGLAINRFPGDGITINPDASEFRGTGPSACSGWRRIMNNYLGTDPTGRAAAPNGLRGISSAASGYTDLSLIRNVISGNVRSGVFLWQGSGGYSLNGNRIGTAADGRTPLPNGASGVYVGANMGGDGTSINDGASVLLDGNVIAFNRHWGVAADPARASRVRVVLFSEGQAGPAPNLIHSNGNPAFDWGLDLVAASYHPSTLIPNPPVLTEAFYDEARNVTVIRGRVDRTSSVSYIRGARIAFFTAGGLGPWGHAEMQEHVGNVLIDDGTSFEFLAPGDLRGRFLTATKSVTEFQFDQWKAYQTSEPSPPLLVPR